MIESADAKQGMGVNDTGYGKNATYKNEGGRTNVTAIGLMLAGPGLTRPSKAARQLAFLHRPT
jgi:hypothetical protein